MYLWNLPESIGSLLLTFLKDIVHITVANPKWVKAIKGNKDDVKDPKWIDGLSHFGLVPWSYIPKKQFVFSVNIPDIALNLFPVKAVKRTISKIPSLFVM